MTFEAFFIPIMWVQWYHDRAIMGPLDNILHVAYYFVHSISNLLWTDSGHKMDNYMVIPFVPYYG